MEPTPQERMICQRRVRKEQQELMASPPPNVRIGVAPDNNLKWYFLIHDLHEERFEGGEYIMQIILSPRYPLTPPDFYMLTPNGRFEVGKKLCFSNSSIHGESWSPMWNIRTMLLGFVSFLLDPSTKGIGHLNTPEAEVKALAEQSKAFNQENLAEILQMIASQNGL